VDALEPDGRVEMTPRSSPTPAREPRFVFAVAYRSLFLAGALHAIVSIGLWAWLVESWRMGQDTALATALPAAWLHAHAMLFGTFPFYAFGFLGTAFPRWVGAPGPTPRRIAAWLALLVGGQLALFAGAVATPTLLGVAFALELAAFAALLVFLIGTLRRGTGEVGRAQPRLVVGAFALGAIALGLDAAALLGPDARLHFAGIQLALHGWLLLLVVGVAWRIVPFFTSSVLRRPPAARSERTLAAFLGIGIARVLLAGLADAPRFVALLDAALALLLARELVAWRPGRALREPMLAVLYAGLAWVVVALAGFAIAGLAPGLAPRLELSLRHALAVGGFTTLVLGISTRVSLGHSGRPIVADGVVRAAFVLIQLAALTRIALPWLASAERGPASLAHLAALPWIAGFALWLFRLGPRLVGPPQR